MTCPAAEYADRLLDSLGCAAVADGGGDPLRDWAGSGAMALTGPADGPPLVSTGPAVAARGALLALAALAPGAALPGVEILGERASFTKHRRQGATSCSGVSKLLAAADGVVAVTLAREADLELLPALVEGPVTHPWTTLTAWLSERTTAEAAARLALLGLPFGVVGEVTAALPWKVSELAISQPVTEPALVVNLGALWAAPLAGAVLRGLGCQVVKVEATSRPDGSRQGTPDFFARLHSGVEQIRIDVATAAGRGQLEELLLRADVVLEGSRKRALTQLGLAAEDIVPRSDRVTWVTISGHGREQDRVGFGDDAAAAGCLVTDGCFVGDAIADPLTGVHAALAAWSGLLRGGSRIVDVGLSAVAATAHGLDSQPPHEVFRDNGQWWVQGDSGTYVVAEPWRP